ncbi:MAG: flagellar FliJ family protein [Planctomycetes bacterium]|nr:flagellar FliJ family protein [Planctomycetota bacterium]
MAKKFKFRVEPALKLRQQRERLALRKLADARRQQGQIEEGIRHLRRQISEQDALVRQGVLTGTVDVQYMSMYRTYVMALHRRIIDHADRLRAAAAQTGQMRAEATGAVKQRKVLSTLKEKLKGRYEKQLAHSEQQEVDEMATTQAAHRRLAGGVLDV